MTLLNDEIHVAEWLKARIEADTTLTAYFGAVPTEATLPAVRFTVQVRDDVRGVGTPAHRIMTNLDWLVAVVSEGHSLVPLVTLADQLDAALHDHSGATATISVLTCVRLEPFSMLEQGDSGVYYRHAGGLYRTVSQPL